MPNARENLREVDTAIIFCELSGEPNVEAVRHAQVFNERDVWHGVIKHCLDAESLTARDTLHFHRHQNKRCTYRFCALFDLELQRAERDIERACASLFKRALSITVRLGRALEEFCVVELRAQRAASEFFFARFCGHLAHRAACAKEKSFLVPKDVLEERDCRVAFRNEWYTRGVAVVEQSVAEGEIEQLLFPRFKPRFARSEFRLGQRRQIGGLDDFVIVCWWFDGRFIVALVARDHFGERMKSRISCGAHVDDHRCRRKSIKPTFADGECFAETLWVAAERSCFDDAHFAECAAIHEASRAFVHGVCEVFIHRGERDRRVLIAEDEHRPKSAGFEERCKRHGEIKAVTESIAKDIRRGANFLACLLKACLQHDVRNRTRCERFVATFGHALHARSISREVAVECTGSRFVFQTRGRVAQEFGDGRGVWCDKRSERLAVCRHARPMCLGRNRDAMGCSRDGRTFRRDETHVDVNVRALG